MPPIYPNNPNYIPQEKRKRIKDAEGNVPETAEESFEFFKKLLLDEYMGGKSAFEEWNYKEDFRPQFEQSLKKILYPYEVIQKGQNNPYVKILEENSDYPASYNPVPSASDTMYLFLNSLADNYEAEAGHGLALGNLTDDELKVYKEHMAETHN